MDCLACSARIADGEFEHTFSCGHRHHLRCVLPLDSSRCPTCNCHRACPAGADAESAAIFKVLSALERLGFAAWFTACDPLMWEERRDDARLTLIANTMQEQEQEQEQDRARPSSAAPADGADGADCDRLAPLLGKARQIVSVPGVRVVLPERRPPAAPYATGRASEHVTWTNAYGAFGTIDGRGKERFYDVDGDEC